MDGMICQKQHCTAVHYRHSKASRMSFKELGIRLSFLSFFPLVSHLRGDLLSWVEFILCYCPFIVKRRFILQPTILSKIKYTILLFLLEDCLMNFLTRTLDDFLRQLYKQPVRYNALREASGCFMLYAKSVDSLVFNICRIFTPVSNVQKL